MAKVRSWAGLDVHARSVLAVMDPEPGELRSARLPGEIRDAGRVPGEVARSGEGGV